MFTSPFSYGPMSNQNQYWSNKIPKIHYTLSFPTVNVEIDRCPVIGDKVSPINLIRIDH